MARRGENIYHRKDGRWEARIPCGTAADGHKKYRSVYGKTYSEVKMKSQNIKPAITGMPTGRLCIEEALNIWMEDKRFEWKESTYSCYRQIAQKQLIPVLGKIPVNKMNNRILNDFIAEKKTGTEVLSDSYIRDMTRMLVQSLKHLKTQYDYTVPENLSALKPKEKEKKELPNRQTMEKLEKYLLQNLEDNTCLGILLCCHTGLRIGEICALRWGDIDLENGMIYVRRNMQRTKVYKNGTESSQIVFSTPKSRRSARDIPLPPVILELLKSRAGEPEQYLIQGRNAPYAEPRTLQYRFRHILEQCEIEYFNFHMLRHIFATRCVTLGFDTNSVSELLGHANIQTTLSLYVHSSAERKRELMSHFYLA